MPFRFHRLAKIAWLTCAILIILLAIISSIFRALTPWAAQYKHQVEQHLSQLFNEPVTVQSMETGWYWFDPVIKLQQVIVTNASGEPIKLHQLLVGVDLWSSLLNWQIKPGILYLEGLDLRIKKQRGHWNIEGLSPLGNKAFKWDAASVSPVLAWFFSQQKVILKRLTAQIIVDDKSVLTINQLNIVIEKKHGQFNIIGKATTNLQPMAALQLQANVQIDPALPFEASGHAFIAATNIPLDKLPLKASQLPLKITNGKVNSNLWVDWHKGRLTSLQGTLIGDEIEGIMSDTHLAHHLNAFQANFLWQNSKKGWELSVDRLQFLLDNMWWPTRQLLITYEHDLERYKAFVSQLKLQQILPVLKEASFAHDWPAFETTGTLNNLQLQWKAHQLLYFLTQFDDLSIDKTASLPSIAHLRGVLHWEPQQGRVELESTDTLVHFANKPPLQFPVINAAAEWKELSQGRRLSLERLVIQHPNLLVNLSGILDDFRITSAGNVHLEGQLSATKAETWLTYLPATSLKPKLAHWLNNNIKKVDSIVADLKLNGFLPDFPFDESRGEFLINGFIGGADLIFADHWPLTTNIDSYFNLNKRQLDFNFTHAQLKNIAIENAHLIINNLGLNREVLLVHSIVKEEASRALAYILSSPLKQKLNAISVMKMAGLISLDLQLEIPLYPENDEVLALGQLTFSENQLLIKPDIPAMSFKALKGTLNFDQNGLMPSTLQAQFLDNPIDLSVQSVAGKNPYTELNLSTNAEVQSLNQSFNLPDLPFLKGHFPIQGQLKITDDLNDLDTLTLSSSLEGLAINLPTPFGKLGGAERKTVMNVAFNLHKKIILKLNYDNAVNGKLTYTPKDDILHFKQGDIQIGKRILPHHSHKGLAIAGDIVQVDWDEWQSTIDSLWQTNKTNTDSLIQEVDLVVDDFVISQQHFKKFAFKLEQLPDHWGILIDQARVSAYLNYNSEKNQLHGTFKHLNIPENLSLKTNSTGLSPQAIPNLNLQIDNISLGSQTLGKMLVKASHSTDSWILDELTLSGAHYWLNATGRWSVNEKQRTSRTDFNGSIETDNLATCLEQFNVTPAVEAHKGMVNFSTTWNGGFADFSLKNVSGNAALLLKEGRITHLGPEAEEKLGLGKLLSILSLQTIPRRLKLDFSDLSGSGFSFDEFKGNFSINKGRLSTQDSYLNGPIAYVTMNGDLDLARQLYDLNLEIYPHITASLPLVATIAGGPIAGIATWVAGKLITQGVQKINGYTYKISGPWRKPIVQQVTIIRKKN